MTSRISANDLTRMRTEVNTLMPDTCNLLTNTIAADGQGGYTDSWGTASAGVACRLDKDLGQQRDRESMGGAGLRPYSQWTLVVPFGTTINAQMRVEHDSVTYNVTAVKDTQSWKTNRRAILEEVT